MRSTTVSPENHSVRTDAGCTWGDVDHATVAFGMATPSGGGEQIVDGEAEAPAGPVLYWQELHPTSAGGAYINFMMDDWQDRVKASYRGNYDRLTQIKGPATTPTTPSTSTSTSSPPASPAHRRPAFGRVYSLE